MAEILDLNPPTVPGSSVVTYADNMTLKEIKLLGLNDVSIGEKINDNFKSINDNFEKILSSDFLRGTDGNNVRIVQITFKKGDNESIKIDDKLLFYEDEGKNLKHISPDLIAGLIDQAIHRFVVANCDGQTGGLATITNPRIQWNDNLNKDQYISFVVEEIDNQYIIKSSIWYIYNDPRFANPTNNVDYAGLFNATCVVYYNGKSFEVHQPFPTIYYNADKGFCWKINNEYTEISAQGLEGLPGNSYPMHIAIYDTKDVDDTNPNNTQELKLISVFNPDQKNWKDTDDIDSHDLIKYQNCTAICLPSKHDQNNDEDIPRKDVYISIIQAVETMREDGKRGVSLIVPVRENLSISSYLNAEFLNALMSRNKDNEIFIPYYCAGNQYQNIKHIFKLDSVNNNGLKLIASILKDDSEILDGTVLELNYKNINIPEGSINVANGDGIVNGKSTSLYSTNSQSNINDCLYGSTLKKYNITKSNANIFSTNGDNNSLLWVGGSNDEKYGHQIGFSNNGNIYHRVKDNDKFSEWTSLNSETYKVTHSELLTLQKNNLLTPGVQYRITDYNLILDGGVKSMNYNNIAFTIKSANHPFDIIVEALGKNKLSENAKAIQHEGDTYFNNSNLNSWELKYCITNDTGKCNWVGKNSKGYIYYMKDEYDNVAPYDFKNMQFVSSTDEINPILNISSDENMSMDLYTFSYINLNDSQTISETTTVTDFSLQKQCRNNVINSGGVQGLQLTKNLFLNTSATLVGATAYCACNILHRFTHNNIFGQYSHTNTLHEYCTNNSLCNKAIFNVLKYDCKGIVLNAGVHDIEFDFGCNNINIGESSHDNKFYSECDNINIGASCAYNVFMNACKNINSGDDCSNNIYHSYCGDIVLNNKSRSNEFGSSCKNIKLYNENGGNNFGVNCSSITLNGGCNNNVFNSGCSSIELSLNCLNNIFDSNCRGCALRTNCSDNKFNSDCKNIILDATCRYNTFGQYCDNITLGENCTNNSFDSNCYGDIFNFGCTNNVIGSGCNENTFETNCVKNILGSGCNKNKFGAECNNNVLGPSCTGNTIGSKCRNNNFNSDCNGNEFGDNCLNNTLNTTCNKNKFGDNCTGNKLDSNCTENEFSSGCNYNILGVECDSNKLLGTNNQGNCFKSRCYRNNFNGGCNYNILDSCCHDNNLSDNSLNNSFGSSCSNNTFGSYCSGNTLDPNCTYIKLSNSSTNNSFGSSCTRCAIASDDTNDGNVFGPKCSEVYLANAEYLSELLGGVKTDAGTKTWGALDSVWKTQLKKYSFNNNHISAGNSNLIFTPGNIKGHSSFTLGDSASKPTDLEDFKYNGNTTVDEAILLPGSGSESDFTKVASNDVVKVKRIITDVDISGLSSKFTIQDNDSGKSFRIGWRKDGGKSLPSPLFAVKRGGNCYITLGGHSEPFASEQDNNKLYTIIIMDYYRLVERSAPTRLYFDSDGKIIIDDTSL